MKLILCNKCFSVFSLTKAFKQCDCKECFGMYVDNLIAEYSGDCTLIGFANSSFVRAVKSPGIDFTAFTISKDCKTFKKIDKWI